MMWNWWLSVGGHWQNLRHYFGLTGIRFFVSYFAVTPIVLHLFERFPEYIKIPTHDEIIEVNLQLPFSWWLLWFSSFAYTIALCVYLLRVPGFIRQNPNYKTYCEAEHSPRWLVWELFYSWDGISNKKKLAERLIEKKYAVQIKALTAEQGAKPRVEGGGTIWEFKHGKHYYEVCIDESISEKKQKEVFWEIFGRWAESRTIARWIVWLSFSIAFLLFVVVVVENIWFVITYLLA